MTTLTGWRANKSAQYCGSYANQTCEPLSTSYRPMWYLDLLRVLSLPAGLLMCRAPFWAFCTFAQLRAIPSVGLFAFGFF
jgi:hypothetical protein